LHGLRVSAYTALMKIQNYSSVRLIALIGIAILNSLTSGCYSTNATYYRQPVSYVSASPYYTGYYAYPAYNPVIIPIDTPRNTWNSTCPPCSWHHIEEREEHPCHQRRAVYYHPQEVSGNYLRPLHQYANKPTLDQGSIPQRFQSPNKPPSAMPGYVTQQRPSFVNN